MKSWSRATIVEPCGRCGRPIPQGEPELLYQFAEVHRVLKRCAACAGEPVPADLPPREPAIEASVIGGGARSPRSVRSMRDWKQRQSGDAT